MKVKKILFILGVSFFLGGLFSCANGNSPVLEESEQAKTEEEKTEEEKTEEEKTESESIKGVSFNISDLTSLAIADETTATRSAARSTVSEGMLVKLLEDGTVENFINVPEGASLSPVSFVTQSPAQNSKEIYIVFESSSGWYEPVERTDEWGNTWTEEWGNYVTLRRLLCVYENGSYVDVLATEDGSWKDLCNNGNQDSPIKFDGQGNMYYQVWESAGNSSTSMIYKFDPKKKESKQLTPQVPNVSYEQFYVSTDGNWIFAKANRWNSSGSSTNYLRAIPVSDANNPVNLFYDSTGSKWLYQWVYDEVSKNVYYTIDGGLYRIPYKNGTYNQESKELILGENNNNNNYSGSFWWDTFLMDSNWYYEYHVNGMASAYDLESSELYDYKNYYFIDPADKITVKYDEIVKYLYARANENFKSGRTEYYDEELGWVYNYFDASKEYEIRFDEFANVPGFEKLATETKGLSDVELVKALVEKDLLKLLCDLSSSERYMQNLYNDYDNNFFADVLYNKETGEKINKELFLTTEIGYFDTSADFTGWITSEYIDMQYVWKSDFLKEDGTVDAEKVLAKFAECCRKDAIDFSLDFFEDCEYENLKVLYTTEKNEAAIEFLDTKEKRQLFGDAICKYGWEFLTYTCFIPDTDTPAYSLNNGNNDYSINYWSLENFTLVGQTLYASDRNNNGKLVMLIDENANPVGKFLDIDYESELKVASTLVHNGVFYFQNAIVNASGEEVGAHKILRLDPTASSIEDMFYNMPNNTTFEVISYTVGGQNLYCCLSKGTEIQTVKIDVKTRQYTQLASGTKLKQIIVVK